jgi:mannose-6-phosphate isomerase class I
MPAPRGKQQSLGAGMCGVRRTHEGLSTRSRVLVALLNHVVLAEGEALFVQAGVAPCYLRGFGAELMASSDNVLGAGLTAKRVNVRELLQVLDFRAASPRCFTRRPTGSRRHTRRPSEISGSAAFGSAHIGFGCRPTGRRS